MRRALATLLAVIAAVGLTGCGTTPLLKEGRAVTFLSPSDGASVHLPLTVKWAGALPPGGSYGVMIDATPPPPGKSIWSLVGDKVGCFTQQLCLTKENLQAHGADFTPGRTYRFSDTNFATGSRVGRHQVTVVVLDRNLRRVDENAYTVAFVVRSQPATS